MKPSVAITIRSFNQSDQAMKKLKDEFEIVYINTTDRHLSEKDLISALKNAEYVVAGTELFSKKVLEESPNLKVISRVGIGTDNIDINTAKKFKIRILNTLETPGLAVAEHTLALLFAVLKKIPQYNTKMRNGDYSIEPGIMLSGKNIGIVGLGRIGYRVSTMLSALGAYINYYDPYLKNKFFIEWKSFESLEELVSSVEIVSLHIPAQINQSAIFNDMIFKQCKKGIILINTARGSLIDEKALICSLDTGIVSAAGLDVFSKEPYSGELLKYYQVIVTPHIASNTIESRKKMELEAVNNMINTFRI